MPLLGRAAMLLLFDIAPDAIAEHDDWHTHEHLPERLAIPGFLRGTRWVALEGRPRYMVIYEVESLDTLTSAPYLARLDAPSAWTARMMPHYRGMRRGFCTVAASVGVGTGHVARLARFEPAARFAIDPREVLAPLALTPGVGGAHLLRGVATPPMTNEQRIRGADAGVDAALVVTGYRADAVRALALLVERLGATNVAESLYRLDYAVSATDIASRGSP